MASSRSRPLVSMIALWGSSPTPGIANVSQTHDRWGAIGLPVPVLELIIELQQVIIARCPSCSRRSSEFHRFGGAISRAARQECAPVVSRRRCADGSAVAATNGKPGGRPAELQAEVAGIGPELSDTVKQACCT